jgi:hypothetical protein
MALARALWFMITSQPTVSLVPKGSNCAWHTLRLLEAKQPNGQTDRIVFQGSREDLHLLLDPNIPPDNNSSERAIRNIKTKIKVSGQFKSDQGAQDYATIRFHH